jgi:hypothetical protein
MVETRRAVFSLKDGEVTLEWPMSITPEEADDLEAYLKLTMRVIHRVAGRLHPRESMREQLERIMAIDKCPDQTSGETT